LQEYCLASRFYGQGQTYAQQQTVFEFASKTTVPGSVNQKLFVIQITVIRPN